MASELECAYFAGLLDVKGTFILYCTERKRPKSSGNLGHYNYFSTHVFLQVDTTEETLADLGVTLFGGSKLRRTRKGRKGTYWRLQFDAASLDKVLSLVAPHIRIKTRLFEICARMRRLIAYKDNHKGLSYDQRRLREEVFNEFKLEMNRRADEIKRIHAESATREDDGAQSDNS